MSAYRLAADLVVLVHLAFVLFVVLGGLLALRWRWVPWVHLPVVLYGFLIQVVGWVCPLTPLENRLRRAAGEAGYEGGFVEHYILPILYPGGLTREIQLALALLVVVVNGAIYTLVWRRRHRA
ncbi:MAG: DUF2784 domain-containing protein [Thermoanaerobaculia bacterium]